MLMSYVLERFPNRMGSCQAISPVISFHPANAAKVTSNNLNNNGELFPLSTTFSSDIPFVPNCFDPPYFHSHLSMPFSAVHKTRISNKRCIMQFVLQFHALSHLLLCLSCHSMCKTWEPHMEGKG